MTRIFRGAIKKLPGHISCRFMPTARWTLYLHIYSSDERFIGRCDG